MDLHQISSWVSQAQSPDQRELRQGVHTILAAISQDPYLRDAMIMKGGILLAVRYQSVRFTRDIDFSATLSLKELDPITLRKRLDNALRVAVETLDYDLDCKVQSCKVQPANQPDASFPSINLTIGHAYKGSPSHKRLLQGNASKVISIDYSLNEIILEVESIKVGICQSISAYALPDLVAEKFRSLLQQTKRNRYRRQDVYDLALLSDLPINPQVNARILESLRAKSRAREIEPTVDSLADPEVKRRASRDYATLRDEVEGELPNFETAYARVLNFYASLPW